MGWHALDGYRSIKNASLSSTVSRPQNRIHLTCDFCLDVKAQPKPDAAENTRLMIRGAAAQFAKARRVIGMNSGD